MPQTAPDSAHREPSPELFREIGLNPEHMYEFIVAMEYAVTKNVVAQIEYLRTEILAELSIRDARAEGLADKVADAVSNNRRDFGWLNKEIERRFKMLNE